MSDFFDTIAAALPAMNEGTQAVQNAAPNEVDAHKNLLSEVIGMLGNQGVPPQQVAQEAGLPHVDVNNLNPGQIVQLTQQLAQQHPEIVAMIAQKFPAAQGILGYLTGGANGGSGGGGLLGGLLGNIL